MRLIVLVSVLVMGCGDGAEMPPAEPDAGGAMQVACVSDSDCPDGVCEGMGCGDTAGACRTDYGGCFRDAVDYCGCDGDTFRASSNCPASRYAHRGACM